MSYCDPKPSAAPGPIVRNQAHPPGSTLIPPNNLHVGPAPAGKIVSETEVAYSTSGHP
jgi:hypothetical protein